ncbi:hypothetical protein PUN28_020825 [Cardiocondyla obscurior]|uniref:Uncharacterized protein n=1 Tax=Cardiocondyla obscurior TaxID=286306 RepID=A0AAW2EAT8_9HYME
MGQVLNGTKCIAKDLYTLHMQIIFYFVVCPYLIIWCKYYSTFVYSNLTTLLVLNGTVKYKNILGKPESNVVSALDICYYTTLLSGPSNILHNLT